MASTGRAEETRGPVEQLVWEPQPRQYTALVCPAFELFYGGAAGGGKSDFLLMDFVQGIQQYGEAWRGVIFRRTYPELEELLARAYELYPRLRGSFSKTEKTWTFDTGAILKFRYIERDSDVHNYQGHQYSWVGWDELTNWPTDFPYKYLMSRVRSPKGVPTAVRAAGNPGGPGHVWVKERFIDPAPPEHIWRDPETGLARVYIPAKLEDNQILMQNDPQYEQQMKLLPDHLYRALREGDWTVFAGQVFSEFREDRHVVRPFALDPGWYKFTSMDWGYAKPFSIGWWAVTGDGRMIRYREWYGCEPGQRNTGVKMHAKDVAKKAWEMSVGEGATSMVADPAVWNAQGMDNTIADMFASVGFDMEKGVNDRMSGKGRVHELLGMEGMDGRPMMLIFDTCRDFIRTIPTLVYDANKHEDVDTTGEDHIYDEVRYACMSPKSHMVHNRPPLQADQFNLQDPADDYNPLDW